MQLGRIIDTTLRVSIRFTNMRTGRPAGDHADHKKIYDAIADNEPLKAAAHASSLVTAALATIKKAIMEQEKQA
jgi:DNA-binding FadR family transcriptional regulator